MSTQLCRYVFGLAVCLLLGHGNYIQINEIIEKKLTNIRRKPI